ncbi:multidrug effflux MFS transporter [Roseibium suaedae]|uniref:Bcr/CflA family efflux transporter n=1 Tax=Roseibium suaedae TaxID=735517 RepID=A0A1M7NJF7_9HYPH|nr:multidrug effflux MFS transporter [Roseibium suaedae]SHN04059.1 MFS transporter, DHA1 family, bicyclomycin/chloramphenicol resistance protein [Roseibium suaedae]
MKLLPSRDISRAEFIGIVAALMALNSLAIDIMLPALPFMGDALGVSTENERQFIISAYMMGYGVGEIFFGPVSDRFGRRGPLLAGIAIYIFAAIAVIFSPSFFMVLALRFVQGLGAASTRVIATSIVRDRYVGRAMAEVMSMVFMLFMAIPILAPGLGQMMLAFWPWQSIFLFMGGLAMVVGLWTLIRLPETLSSDARRSLGPSAVIEAFNIVVMNREAISYGLAGTFMFASLFGFLTSAQQIYVGIYGLGPYFPVAFASVAALMGLASFTNSKAVARLGMRRLSHGAALVFTGVSGLWLVLAETIAVPFWLFLPLLAIIMSCFGWAAANMNSLSMEPLGEVAGTASSVFGFIQTVGGVLIGGYIGQQFDGTVIPVAAGYFAMGILCLLCILVAENGRIFRMDVSSGGDACELP